MSKRNRLFGLLAIVSILFIVYALVKNYIVDPGAESFLSHKTDLRRELHLSAWLSVMRVHVAFACIAMATGLLNFSNRLFKKSRKFHRINGYVYVISVLIVIATSGYMAPYATGGKAVSMGFNLLNLIWLGITVAALVHIRQKKIVRHRNGMIRSYAFCFTNMSIHLLTTVLNGGFGIDYSIAYTFGVYGSIALLLAVPGIVIRLLRPFEKAENA